MENYFNYFTEIEEHFQRRRGRIQLSPLDWALIETWKDAGVPLEAVLRGVDAAFDKYEQRPSKSQKINSLAYCAQAVLGGGRGDEGGGGGCNEPRFTEPSRQRFSSVRNLCFPTPQCGTDSTTRSFPKQEGSMRRRWREKPHAHCARSPPNWTPTSCCRDWKIWSGGSRWRRRNCLRLYWRLPLTSRSSACGRRLDRELAPYRRKMPSAQIEQLQKQFVHKRLLEKYGIPRLSLVLYVSASQLLLLQAETFVH